MMRTDSADTNTKSPGGSDVHPDRHGSDALHVLETIGAAAVLTDLDGRIREMTGGFINLSGFNREELENAPLDQVVTGLVFKELTDDAVQADVEECLEENFGELHSDGLLCIVTKSGALRWVHPHICTIDDPSGRIARLFVLHDITPIRSAQQAAEESDSNYRMLVEQANTVVMQMDADLSIRFINEYGAHLFGYSREDLTGQSLLETLVPSPKPHETDSQVSLYEVAAAPELHGDFDQQTRCADGTWIWVHWAVRGVRSEAGEVTGLLCIGTDVTRRKHAEIRAEWYLKRSRRLADQLVQTEERERSRIAQYLHDQVLQVLSLANIRMGGLLHSLNRADCTDEADHLAEVRHLVEDAIGECRSMMNELVPTLLYEVGLGAALKHLTEQEHVTDGRSIRVDDRLGKTPLPRRVSGLLFQSARELLMNALKYAGSCEIEIRITADDKQVEVTVSDNGKGFNPDELNRPSPEDTGGFGLFNIRERLEALGGVLTVTSAPGQGTRAAVSVPLPCA